MSAHIQYKDEVGGLTAGQCIDHPKFPTWWGLVRTLDKTWQVFDYDTKDYVGGAHFYRASALRNALASMLDERPPKVTVTREDRELAYALGFELAGAERPSELIAAYRVKHSQQAGG